MGIVLVRASNMSNKPIEEAKRHASPIADDRRAVAKWLRCTLELWGGRCPAPDVVAMSRRAGVADRTLRLAKRDVGAVQQLEGTGRDVRAFWSLPCK